MSELLRILLPLCLLAACAAIIPPPSPPLLGAGGQNIGIFEGQGDVGTTLHVGSSKLEGGVYTVTGSGANMWAAEDDFHFVWKRVSGDLSLAADIKLQGQGTEPHRKACLMIRQSLDADSAYADLALHGDGLTSLQFRLARGEPTHEIQANSLHPGKVRIERRGKYVRLYVSPNVGVNWPGEPEFSGAAQAIELHDPVYVGLGVCAHHKDQVESATFANVALKPLLAESAKPQLYSTLETQSVASSDRRVVRVFTDHVEAPNWMTGGEDLLYNSGGRLYHIPVGGGEAKAIDTGFAVKCNNDHGISFNGKTLAISDGSQGDGQSRIYTLPLAGGIPSLITANAPSYWHGWSPDGKTLAYCAQRNGEFDIYTIPATGGEETRLTTAPGLDDGPEYAPDGNHIYFNSERTGKMQVWRMRPDGNQQERLTHDELNNWFPHLSPDGRTMLFLTFEADVKGHPPNKEVMIRRMDLATGKVDVMARLFGGQGTMNVPNWSPDGKRIAFVSYQLIGAGDER